MDKCFLFFLLNCIIFANPSPIAENEEEIKLKSFIRGSSCNFPPRFLALDETYSSQFQACYAGQQNAALKQMCLELEKESMCRFNTSYDAVQNPFWTKLPTTDVTKNLFSGSDKQSHVSNLCQYMTSLPWSPDDCTRECLLAFFICDLYVVMDKVLRAFFEQEVQDYTHLDVFVHSGELAFLYPFPPIGSLHNRDMLLACSSPPVDGNVQLLCKVVAEVAVKFVKDKVKGTFHEKIVTENVTSIWDPCTGMSAFTSFSSSPEFVQLQQRCHDLCETHMGICKMIYLGMERYMNLTGNVGLQNTDTGIHKLQQPEAGNLGGHTTGSGGLAGQQTGTGNIGGQQAGPDDTGEQQTETGNTGGQQTGPGNIGEHHTGTDITHGQQTEQDNTGGLHTGTGNKGEEQNGHGNPGGQQTEQDNTGEQQTGTGNTGGQPTGPGNIGEQHTGTGINGGQQTKQDNTGEQQTATGNTGGQPTGPDNTGGLHTGTDNNGGQQNGHGDPGGQQTEQDNTGEQQTGTGNSGGQETGPNNTGGQQTGTGITGGQPTGQDNTGEQLTATGNTGGQQTGTGNTGGQPTGPDNTGGLHTGTDNNGGQLNGHGNPGGQQTEQDNTGEQQTGTGNSGGQKTGTNKTGGQQTGTGITGGQPIGQDNTGEQQTATGNTGGQSSGTDNTGRQQSGTGNTGGQPTGPDNTGGQPDGHGQQADDQGRQFTGTTNGPKSSTDEYDNYEDYTTDDYYVFKDPSPLENQLDKNIEENKKPEETKNDNVQQDKAGKVKIDDDESSGSHFMAYFLVFIVLSIAGYIVFHNKQKIIALVIEGKTGKGGRRPNTKEYKQLKTDDVMPSLEKSAYSKDYVF